MQNDDHIRLDNMERTIIGLTEQVSRVASYMERLVVVEERNSTMAKVITDFRADMKEELKSVKDDYKELNGKYESLNARVIQLFAGIGVISVLFSMVGPMLIKTFLGG